MADELAPDAAATVAEAPETAPESLADHESLFGAPDPTLEGEAKVKNDEARAKVRHRAKSQQAGPDDVGRIGELTKKLRATEAERDALKARPAVTAPAAPASHAPAQSSPSGPERGGSGQPQPTRPKPEMSAYEDEVGLKYQTYGEAVSAFQDDRDAWKDEQVEAKRQRESQQRQHDDAQQSFNAALSTYHERLTEFVKTHPDYPTLLAQHSSINLPPAPHKAILTHDNGPAFVYHLVQHPDQLAEVVLLFDGKPPSDEFVAHATRWLSSRTQAASTGSAAPAPPLTLAARPPNPVRTGPSKSDSEPPGDDNMSLADHEKAYGQRRRS